ncbi:unnamed protein product [Symbiodinium necroappetens]|uniref:Uncharacterized protein n=1 Tax=Symbiodinium necroappetens TaxID=1628268 RepID=A0A812ZLT4_9DINO|nr:unnamed protein product [Symbiodinium necroappetens]
MEVSICSCLYQSLGSCCVFLSQLFLRLDLYVLGHSLEIGTCRRSSSSGTGLPLIAEGVVAESQALIAETAGQLGLGEARLRDNDNWVLFLLVSIPLRYIINPLVFLVDQFGLCVRCLGVLLVGASAVFFVWYSSNLAPEPHDYQSFEQLERSSLLPALLLVCTLIILVFFSLANLRYLRAGTMPPMPVTYALLVGKVFLLMRMAMSYSSRDMTVALDYFVKQELILISSHALGSFFLVPWTAPTTSEAEHGPQESTTIREIEKRMAVIALIDLGKTLIMLLYWWQLFAPGCIEVYVSRAPAMWAQVVLALAVHLWLDLLQSAITVFTVHLARLRHSLMQLACRAEAMIVDAAFCFQEEDGSIEVNEISLILADRSGLQTHALQGLSVARNGPACVGMAFISWENMGCGIVYTELTDMSAVYGVTEYLWNPGLQARVTLPSTWPRTRHKRAYALALRVMPKAAAQELAEFMQQPQWKALQLALTSSSNWLDSHVTSSLAAVRALFEATPDAQQAGHAIVELGTARAAEAFAAPGKEEDDFWAFQVYAVTTYWLVELMHCWEDGDKHQALVQETLGHFQRFWPSEFALPEHRGFVPGLGFWDGAALMLRQAWPRNVRPTSPDAAAVLMSLLRGGMSAAIPSPLPASTWWNLPPFLDPLTLRHQVASSPGREDGLRVIMIEMHRMDYQELRALMERVSEDLFGAPARFYNYFLTASEDAEELDVQEELPTHGNDAHIFLEHGIAAGLAEVAGWIEQEHWKGADLVAGCTPLWACVALFQVLPDMSLGRMPFLVRQNMALLQFYHAWSELPLYWSMLHDFMASRKVTISWKHRLGAEQVFDQTGARPAYVPLISLHTDGLKYQPSKQEQRVGAGSGTQSASRQTSYNLIYVSRSRERPKTFLEDPLLWKFPYPRISVRGVARS